MMRTVQSIAAVQFKLSNTLLDELVEMMRLRPRYTPPPPAHIRIHHTVINWMLEMLNDASLICAIQIIQKCSLYVYCVNNTA